MGKLATTLLGPGFVGRRLWQRPRLLVLAAATAACTSAPSGPAVTVEGGMLQGRMVDGSAVYKGVPFAEPPVADLRWREPQPVSSWTGTREADEFAPACMQRGVSMPGEAPPRTSEDCLYLNLWTPADGAGDRLPVMVWIYGGGFTNGAASLPLYWGDRLARKGVVVVSIAYRLGPFGFLAHPELTAESAHRTSGNYGLMDQIAALRWIREHIEAFGGDPDNVTVFGQSAGATSISILMASPLAKGLFHRAIGQSGGLFEPLELAPAWLLENAERDGEAYAASLGAESIAELREMPSAELLGGSAGAVSHPVIDPYLLPSMPYDIFASGEQSHVPLLVGSNADEARSLLDPAEVRAASFEDDIAERWGALPPALLKAYPFETDAEARQARLDFERDLRFGWDVWTWARLQAENGSQDVYYYYFTHEPPFPPGTPYADWGAGHFAELWYVFDRLDLEPWPWRAADRELADTLSTYWTNFARTGDPNGAGLPQWPPFSDGNDHVLYLQETPAVGGVPNLGILSVFESVYSQIRGTRFGAAPALQEGSGGN